MLNLFGGRSKPAEAALTTDASGVPLELIRYDASTGKFQVGEQALAALRKVKTPIGVVSVCGRARQGKSFILNQLLGTAGGFQVGPTVRPCTKGLWMWSSPVKRTAPDGSAYHLVRLNHVWKHHVVLCIVGLKPTHQTIFQTIFQTSMH